MTTRKPRSPRTVTLEAFLAGCGPGDDLETLKARQPEDAEWAERAFEGKERLGPPIRLKRGRPKRGERPPETVVKAIRLPVDLLENLREKAETQGISLNALLQLAALEYLRRHPGA